MKKYYQTPSLQLANVETKDIMTGSGEPEPSYINSGAGGLAIEIGYSEFTF